jgi:hypothetical protein
MKDQENEYQEQQGMKAGWLIYIEGARKMERLPQDNRLLW